LGLLEALWLLSLQDGSGRSDLVQKDPRDWADDAPSGKWIVSVPLPKREENDFV